MTAPTPNAPLAYAVLDHIDEHPEQWFQDLWLDLNTDGELGDCGTVGCFAGWTTQLSGLAAVFNDFGHGRFVKIDGNTVSFRDAATQLLGIDEDDADDLFAGSNSREELGRLVTEIFGPRPDGGEGGNIAGGAA